MKHYLKSFICVCLLLPGAQCNYAQERIVANPMNLNYRFQMQDDNPARREAADPVCEYFKGKYYLFASKSGGYWSSEDLAEWKYIPCKTIATIEEYAPAILVMGDELYFMASGKPRIFKTSNPDRDEWEDINAKFKFQLKGNVDPAFFKDDDGKVYVYWGCSDKDPIIGVEVDPKDGFNVIGEAKILIEHHSQEYGWEEKGAANDQGQDGYNEGPCIIKHKGKYYLQYAAPGTQWRIYGDGVYVADNPLGPYVYDATSPFSFKPGGFVGGAGHGHTFKDRYGNYWHVASMTISVRHMFERRLGLFPVYLSGDGHIHAHTLWSDYPYEIPQQKADFARNDFSKRWNLLSYRKNTDASSSLSEYGPEKAVDERIETWWSAQTGNAGEWLQADLEKEMDVRAVQVNFADHDFVIRAPHPPFYYRYVIEASGDGKKWTVVADKSANGKDAVHDLIVLEKPVKARYLRITSAGEVPGKFSLSGFRIFGNGNGNGKAPEKVSGIRVQRNPDDPRRFFLSWNRQAAADGYVIHARLKGGGPPLSVMVYDNEYESGFFNRDSEYEFSVETFNENGRSKPVAAKARIPLRREAATVAGFSQK
ncbi:MAG: family 43 glycosylhydrolase [Tannerella sp.]|jgi:hypothetical protein|nr:family 43 glycosylhydrolase [Tannerella sp.]